MATPKWIKDIGKSLKANVLPIAAGLIGGGIIGRLTGQPSQAAPATQAAPQESVVSKASGGIMDAKVGGVPVVLLIGGAIAAIVAFKLVK